MSEDKILRFIKKKMINNKMVKSSISFDNLKKINFIKLKNVDSLQVMTFISDVENQYKVDILGNYLKNSKKQTIKSLCQLIINNK